MSEFHESFEDLSQTEFESHASALLGKQRTAQRRKRVLTYLQSINDKDAETIAEARSSFTLRNRQNRQKTTRLKSYIAEHHFDFSKHQELLSDETVSASELDTMLGTDDSEIFLNQSYTKDIAVTGDDIVIFGEGGNGLSARTEELVNQVKITGDITISGKNITFKNMDFDSVGEFGIKFLAGGENVKFENCRFTGPAGHADSKWWYGEFFKGNATLTNCFVQNYSSWMLFDISSTSGEPDYATKMVKIKRCFFKNNLGSAAIRGKINEATPLVQVTNNRFVTNQMHAYFWGFVEVSGYVKKVEVKNNYFEGPAGNEQVALPRHAVQLWSSNPKPWAVYYKDNEIKNMQIGVALAHNSIHYSPDTESDDYLLDLSKTLTNVNYAASFAHNNTAGDLAYEDKWFAGAEYNPANMSVYGTTPAVVNPNGYALLNEVA